MSHHLDLDKVIISGINVFWPKWVLTPCLCQDTVREACLGPEHQFFAFESISVCNSGSLLRKSLILCLYLKFQSQRTAKEWTILPVRFFFSLSILVFWWATFFFFFFFHETGITNCRRFTAWKDEKLCKKTPCEWALCPRNTDTCQSMDLWGKSKRELTAPPALLHSLYGSVLAWIPIQLRSGPTVNQNLMAYWNIP